MKTFTLFSLFFVCSITNNYAQSFSDQIEENLAFAGNTIVVKNIHAAIQVESYEGNEVLLEINRNFSASKSKLLELAKKELLLTTINQN